MDACPTCTHRYRVGLPPLFRCDHPWHRSPIPEPVVPQPDTVTLADRLDDWADWDPDEATIAPDLRAADDLRYYARVRTSRGSTLLGRLADALEADDGA